MANRFNNRPVRLVRPEHLCFLCITDGFKDAIALDAHKNSAHPTDYELAKKFAPKKPHKAAG